MFPTDLAAPGDTANVRLLDPMVLKRVSAGHNITLFREKVEGWERHWREGSADPARMAASWNVLGYYIIFSFSFSFSSIAITHTTLTSTLTPVE